jgi:carboxyl-terminal processing protease
MKKNLIVILILMTSCENLIVNEKVSAEQQSNFDLLWDDFDRNYAGFTVRDMDWDSAYLYSKEAIDAGLSEEAFKSLMINLLLSFEDIHVQFVDQHNNRTGYKANNPNSVNWIGSLENYIDYRYENKVFTWGQVKNENFGYLHIRTFNEGFFSDFAQIDQVLYSYADTDGMIIDVRNNSGGSPGAANRVASRFIDHSYVALKTQYRNGPDHHNFDTPLEGIITPAGDYQYLKPIVLLMNKSSQSAAELFVAALEIHDYITTVGDFSAGGLGLNSYRELPNGWNYRLTTTLTSNRDDEFFEGKGVPPHERVFISKADSSSGIDPQLERAIDLLR